MATVHKMKDEPGPEIVRCFGQGHAGHASKQGSRISTRRVALALSAVVVLLLLVLILETASAWTSAASALPAPGRSGRAPAGAALGMLLAVVAGLGRLAQRQPTSCRNGKI
jgi:hypothetical protein